MCHTAKSGDGCFARGIGGCGGNLLHADMDEPAFRRFAHRVAWNAEQLRLSLTGFRATRGKLV